MPRKCSVQEEELVEMFKRTQELEVKVQQMDIKAIEDLEEQEKLDKQLVNVQAKEVYFRGLFCEALERQTPSEADVNTVKTHLPICLNGRFVI